MPDELGDYQLMEEIGRGGQGVGLSRTPEKSKPHSGTKSHGPRSVGDESAHQTVSP